MLKKILITLVVLGAVIGVVVGVKALQIKFLMEMDQGPGEPPAYVTSATVSEQSWKQTLDAVGSLAAVQGVTVTTEVGGKVETIHFDSGQSVEKGQLLVELDISTEVAQLAAAEADKELAAINLERTRKLRQSNTVAQAELDSANANYLAAEAQVENLKAFIQKKKIVAPFSGRIGIRQVDLGQFINSGDPIVSLKSLDPIYVDFSFPQQWISKVAVGMSVEVTVDSFPDQVFEGKLSAINPEVSESTRTIGLRATLPNRNEQLLPGMFCQVSVVLPNEESVKVIPSTAIVYSSFGDSIFEIVEKEGQTVAEQKFVRLGERRGDFVAVTSGLDAGAEVVSTGAFKLRQGMRVELNNDLNTKPELNPNPSDS